MPMTSFDLARWQADHNLTLRAAALALQLPVGLYRNMLNGRVAIGPETEANCLRAGAVLPKHDPAAEVDCTLSLKVSSRDLARVDRWRADHYDPAEGLGRMASRSTVFRRALLAFLDSEGVEL